MSDDRLAGVRALVVDDSKPLQIIVKRLLEISGAAHVDVADGGTAAAALAPMGRYDLLLVDIQMPEQDGHEVLARLRQSGVNVPAVAMTADPSLSERRRCTASGFLSCLGKPFTRDELADTVRSALSHKSADAYADECAGARADQRAEA